MLVKFYDALRLQVFFTNLLFGHLFGQESYYVMLNGGRKTC